MFLRPYDQSVVISPSAATPLGLALATALALGGCATAPGQVAVTPETRPSPSAATPASATPGEPVDARTLDPSKGKDYAPVPSDIETVPVTIGPPPDPTLEELTYRIGPNDQLSVEVFGQDEFSKTGSVNFQGLFKMPLLGPIPLNGLTAEEAEKKIAHALSERYLRDPQVLVHVVNSANMNVMVSGKISGVRQITGRTTLGQLLSASGGVPPVAKDTEIVIFRASNETRQTPYPKYHAYVVDYDAIIKGKLRDPLLVGNDRIYVPPSLLAIFFDPWLGVFKTYAPVEIPKIPL